MITYTGADSEAALASTVEDASRSCFDPLGLPQDSSHISLISHISMLEIPAGCEGCVFR